MRSGMLKTWGPAALAVALVSSTSPAHAQSDEPAIFTQALLRADSKTGATPTASTTTLEVGGKRTALASLTPVNPNGVQIALLIDDGLRQSFSVQLSDFDTFFKRLPPGVEVLIGYMTNGTVRVAQDFTTDHALVAKQLRIPFGVPGQSASPYFCLSDFVKHWPGNSESDEAGPASGNKARFVLMFTDGVDPYNGSTSILNQDSPYVAAAATDSQRAGVAVSSIYYGDAGIRGGRANFSGQSYLQQVAGATGGESFYQGLGNPVSLEPFFKEFLHDISETYVASFDAPTGRQHDHLETLKVDTSVPKLKLRHADGVRPGNHEGPAAPSAGAGPQ